MKGGVDDLLGVDELVVGFVVVVVDYDVEMAFEGNEMG